MLKSSVSLLKPGAKRAVIWYEKIFISVDKIIIKDSKTIKTLALKIVLYLAKTKDGIKLWLNAPSPNIRLKRFGSLNATAKISLYTFAPSTDAIVKSRINPNILERKIPPLLEKIDFILILYLFTRIITIKY